jgi:hypothetical protein
MKKQLQQNPNAPHLRKNKLKERFKKSKFKTDLRFKKNNFELQRYDTLLTLQYTYYQNTYSHLVLCYLGYIYQF